MTQRIAAAAQKPAVAALNGLSKATDTLLTYTLTGITSAGPNDVAVGFGKAASPPATYADLANPNFSELDQFDSASYAYDALGWSGRAVDKAARANAAWTVGDLVYCCVFDNVAPSAGDVPVAVSAPLSVIA